MDQGLLEFIGNNKDELEKQITSYTAKLKSILINEGVQLTVDTAHIHIDTINEESGLNKVISCSKKCYHCCYGEIAVSALEGTYIKNYVTQNNISYDKELVRKQANAKEHKELLYAHRRCAMLDDQGSCKIYDIRPAICRIHNATTPADQCDESKGDPATKIARVLPSFAISMSLLALTEDGDKPVTNAITMPMILNAKLN